jgi:NedA-like, galactose-binding domain/Putative Ig domain
MGYNLMSCRLTTRSARHGLFKLLLTLMLGTASLPALSSRHSNVTPVISGTSPTSVVAGNRYDFRPSATDANGDRLTFYISNQPAWASFSSRTGELSGTPTSDSVGVYGNIVISVSDRRSSASLPPFDIQVVAVSAGAGDGASTSDGTSGTSTSSGGTGSGGTPVSNTAPVISGTPDTSVVANSAYSFQPTATDADGDMLTFSITNKPSWASFSSSTGKLNGTPATGGSSGNIVISVSDGQASTSLPAFSIQVLPSPRSDLALGMPVVVSSVENAGLLGIYAVDGDGSSRWSSEFTDAQWIYVDLGAIYTIDQVVLNWETAYGKGYEVQVSADARSWVTVYTESDGNGSIDEVDFAPASARYVRVLGVLRGTVWGYSLWEIEVYGSGGGSTTGGLTTGSGTTNLVSNTAPVISGTPDTSVVANSAYSFQPTATDADGDTLTFSITNKPSWASFSSSTGKLNGTPATSGSSGNIVISVSDGQASTSLPAFSITVQAAVVQTGSMSLQWTAPVTRSDGTPLSLSDIDGYRIYYGASAGNYPNRIDVADSTAQSVTVTDMPVGTQYVVMTTYDVNGLESAYSSMVTKNVR